MQKSCTFKSVFALLAYVFGELISDFGLRILEAGSSRVYPAVLELVIRAVSVAVLPGGKVISLDETLPISMQTIR